jgi:Uma2 family endonuclease
MTLASSKPAIALPDHTQLPESDGSFVKNFQEHPQSLLLTSSIAPVLDALHPDGQYAIGQDCGIYWRLTQPPLEQGAEAPDWFYVANVPPLLDGQRRRSYVMWKEIIAPLIAIEFTSGDGSEERDATSPLGRQGANGAAAKAGKFWVYEQAVRIPYYAIYEVEKASVTVYELRGDRYQLCEANARGHYPIAPLGVELGIWQGQYLNQTLPWLRWWDSLGNLLLSGDERAKQERERAEQERERAEQERERAEQERERAEQERERAEQADQRAEQADQRAEQADQRAERLAAQLRALGIEPD